MRLFLITTAGDLWRSRSILESIYSNLVSKSKSKLLEFADKSAFIRERKLGLTHLIGHVLYLVSQRNLNGYDITSQNYYSQLSVSLGKDFAPVGRSSFCEARKKLKWEAFDYLLQQACDDDNSPKWKGHVVKAVDGSWVTLPASDKVLEQFPRRISPQSTTHYPWGILTTVVNVLSGQPTGAYLSSYKNTNKYGLFRLFDRFRADDIALLDRGFESRHLWDQLGKRGIYFVNRVRAANCSRQVTHFLKSKKKCATYTFEYHGKTLQIRLIRGRKDRKGRPIVLATNLLDTKKYPYKQILDLYCFRWKIETMYYRVKTLLNLEKFHAQSPNGVRQEIWANLLLLSLTALAVRAAQGSKANKQPNFKNATEVVRRYLWMCIEHQLSKAEISRLTEQIVNEIKRITCTHQPNRKNQRISKQPANSWNTRRPLAKNNPTSKWERNRLEKLKNKVS